MKLLFQIMCFSLSTSAFGQNPYADCHQQEVKRYEAERQTLEHQYWKTITTVPKGSAMSAQGPEVCIAHNKHVCDICGNIYQKSLENLEAHHKANEKKCDEEFGKADNSIKAQLARERQKKLDELKQYSTKNQLENSKNQPESNNTNNRSDDINNSSFSKWAYCTYCFAGNGPDQTTGPQYVVYVSQIIDLSTIRCPSEISNSVFFGSYNIDNDGGKLCNCAIHWFVEKLAKEFNITDKDTNSWVRVITIANENTNWNMCKDGNCLKCNKADIEKLRRKVIGGSSSQVVVVR